MSTNKVALIPSTVKQALSTMTGFYKGALDSNARNPSLRVEIQGLRALAVLGVILFHIDKEWLPGGFVGVDIFLVISGFLITSILLREKKNGDFSFRHFYLSRLRRIGPAYFMMLAIVSIWMAILLIPKDFNFYEKGLKPALFFFSNQYFSGFGDYFAPAAYELPLQHTWSLAVEMQFYLLLPIIIILLPIRFLKILLPTCVLGLTAYASYRLYLPGSRQTVYFALFSRIPEFLTGSYLALFSPGKKLLRPLSNGIAWGGLILIAASYVGINESMAFPGWIALAPCVGVAMIIANRGGTLYPMLAHPILVWIGNLSFSLYLWHWPILASMRYISESYKLTMPNLALFAALTLGLSYFSYRWIETPFRGGGLQKQSVTRFYALAGTVIFSLLMAPIVSSSVVAPLPVELTRYAPDNTICHGRMVGDCYRGDLTSGRKILVVGDSHAAQLNNFFDVAGLADNFRAKVISGSSCITIPGFDVDRLPGFAQASCAAQIKIAAPLLDAADTIVVAGMWQYHVQSEAFLVAFDRFLATADAKKKQVLIMAQIPMFDSNISRVYRFERLGFKSDMLKNGEWEVANHMIAEVASRYSSVHFLDLSKASLFADSPFYKGVLIYQDNHHLNEIGSKLYGGIAAPYFSKDALHKKP